MEKPKYDLTVSADCVEIHAQDAINAAKAGDRQAFKLAMLKALDAASHGLRQEHNGAPLNQGDVSNG